MTLSRLNKGIYEFIRLRLVRKVDYAKLLSTLGCTDINLKAGKTSIELSFKTKLPY